MPFTQFTNLDFDQIKTSIKDYLRANSNFTDFDFEAPVMQGNKSKCFDYVHVSMKM